jgi:hypothetical protein
MIFLIFVICFILSNLAPSLAYIQAFDILNNNITIKVVDEHTIQTSWKVFRDGPISVPPGDYMYIKYFGYDYEGVQSGTTWIRRFVPLGGRVLGILTIAFDFYIVMDDYIDKMVRNNNLYEAFVNSNPGMGQGTYLVQRDLFNPFVWRLSVQGQTNYFDSLSGKNQKINVYDDQTVNSLFTTGYYEVGDMMYHMIFLGSNFTEEYLNSLGAEYKTTIHNINYEITTASKTEYFGLGPEPVSVAHVAVTIGKMNNEQLEEQMTFADYLNRIKTLANPKAIDEKTGAIEIRGYVFPGMVDKQTGEELPAGFVIPVGENSTFEQDIELVSQETYSVGVQVEPSPEPSDEIDKEKNNWLEILNDLKIKFPFSIPYTYSYLFTLIIDTGVSDEEIVEDIENRIKFLIGSVFGVNVNIELDNVVILVRIMRSFGTLLILLLLVVGYKRLLL